MSFIDEPADPAAYMPPPPAVDYLGETVHLDHLLVLLHRQGFWIEAWYPLSSGAFECRVTCGSGQDNSGWAIGFVALQALYDAMAKAHLVVARD